VILSPFLCSGLGGNPGLCTASGNGGNFIFPSTYNLPCSAPDVISIASAAATAPGGSPLAAPEPVLSPEEAHAPGAAARRRPPAVEVPVMSPDAAPFLEFPGMLPWVLPIRSSQESLVTSPDLPTPQLEYQVC